jgi:AcrR family transcriptional regulator
MKAAHMPRLDKPRRERTNARGKHAPIGPIWARIDREARAGRPALSREQIVRAAIEIADAEGIEALSMRRVAARVRAGTMSLYWHVPSKEDLLDLMRDAIMGEVKLPSAPSGDWRADLRLIAYQTRAALLRHPWYGAIIGDLPSLGPNSLHHVEFALAAVDGIGLDIRAMAGTLSAIDSYVLGFVQRELSEKAYIRQSGVSEEEWRAASEPYVKSLLATGKYPTLARFIYSEELGDQDANFDFGLECILDGIAARLPDRADS